MDISEQHPIQKSPEIHHEIPFETSQKSQAPWNVAASHKERQGLLPVATAGVHRGAVADHIRLQLPWPWEMPQVYGFLVSVTETDGKIMGKSWENQVETAESQRCQVVFCMTVP